MNEFEKRIIHNLKHNYQNNELDTIYSEYGYIVEGAYNTNSLSQGWKNAYEVYCQEYPPETEEFSYMEMMRSIYKKYIDIYSNAK